MYDHRYLQNCINDYLSWERWKKFKKIQEFYSLSNVELQSPKWKKATAETIPVSYWLTGSTHKFLAWRNTHTYQATPLHRKGRNESSLGKTYSRDPKTALWNSYWSSSICLPYLFLKDILHIFQTATWDIYFLQIMVSNSRLRWKQWLDKNISIRCKCWYFNSWSLSMLPKCIRMSRILIAKLFYYFSRS